MCRTGFYIIGLFILSSCASIQNYGTGPVELTYEQQQYYDKYLKRMSEKRISGETWAFAISPTENFAFSVRTKGGRPGQANYNAQSMAIEYCNDEIKANDCKIYDINGEVVWRFSEESSLSPVDNLEIYKECIREVNDPYNIVFFPITENNKTEEYCRCVSREGSSESCFTKVLKNE